MHLEPNAAAFMPFFAKIATPPGSSGSVKNLSAARSLDDLREFERHAGPINSVLLHFYTVICLFYKGI